MTTALAFIRGTAEENSNTIARTRDEERLDLVLVGRSSRSGAGGRRWPVGTLRR